MCLLESSRVSEQDADGVIQLRSTHRSLRLQRHQRRLVEQQRILASFFLVLHTYVFVHKIIMSACMTSEGRGVLVKVNLRLRESVFIAYSEFL